MENEFHNNRTPFYIDNETLLIKMASNKYKDWTHVKWFNEINYPFLHTIRGYFIEGEDPHIIIYWNDFEIPNANFSLLSYLFEYFPTIKWIGVGCNKGKVGEEWKPKLKVTRP